MNGRKRHILVDTTGLLMPVLVQEADLPDHDGGNRLLVPLKPRFPRLKLIWAESADTNGDNARVGQSAGWL